MDGVLFCRGDHALMFLLPFHPSIYHCNTRAAVSDPGCVLWVAVGCGFRIDIFRNADDELSIRTDRVDAPALRLGNVRLFEADASLRALEVRLSAAASPLGRLFSIEETEGGEDVVENFPIFWVIKIWLVRKFNYHRFVDAEDNNFFGSNNMFSSFS